MDTSETYIKMCEKATEIQSMFKDFNCGNLPVFAYDTEIGCVGILFWTPNTLAEKLGQHGNTLWVSIESHRDRKFYSAEAEGMYSDLKIWLPRQDQLQEMVRPNWQELPYMLTTVFNEAANGGSCSYVWDNGKHFTSMEQLWLAFVMKEKYNKTWNKEEWK